ncbi:MAG: hypothetical protein WCG27_01085 [Pseudomonadota bacterium]
MNKNIWVTIIFALGPLAWAGPTLMIREKFNCTITKNSYLKTGEVKSKVYRYNFPAESKCLKMKNIYSQNFSPNEVIKNEVKMDWKRAKKK